MRRRSSLGLAPSIGLLCLLGVGPLLGGACSASTSKKDDGLDPGGGSAGRGAGGTSADGGGIDPWGGLDTGILDGSGIPLGTPGTCDEAAAAKSYIGCDYWPTVVANNVWSVFDYAVVVANAGETEAEITVTGPNGVKKSAKVAPNELTKIYLPWVSELKGPDTDTCGTATPLKESVRVDKGAYHLVSSRPVTVYQFNALEYKGAGGEAGKSWSECPGKQPCRAPLSPGDPIGCFSFSNDASLLLPSTAMTGTYRVLGQHGWSVNLGFFSQNVMGAYVAITATQDGTTVEMKVARNGNVLPGGGVEGTGPGGTVKLSMNAGDVVELVGEATVESDLSGSLIKANKPIQVITGVPCIQSPIGTPACDHIESVSFPAETLGKHYLVTVPTGPRANVVGHVVRIYGNVDGTKLTYSPSAPPGAPSTINAGDVADLAVVKTDFEVTGDQAFGVGSFMLGGSLLDPGTGPDKGQGDPSQSLFASVEQFRRKYVFLAPDDYDFSFVDIMAEEGSNLLLDGAKVTAAGTPIGASGYNVHRVRLGPGKGGAHVLTAAKPVGVQVMGYGLYTSYQYPAGLDLLAIAPPPVK